MSRAKKIKYIVIHCTAGHASAERVQAYFLRPKSKGGRGWNYGGYHRIIEKDGTIEKIYDFDQITNGVRGFNGESIHISYVGGVEEDNVHQAKDTRTQEQKVAIQRCIIEAINWLKENGKDITKDLLVLGHRDFSKDVDQDYKIDSWERIKECPSFSAIPEYIIFSATNSDLRLPQNR